MSKPDGWIVKPVSPTVINKTFDKLIGLHCWNPDYDRQTGLWINFGKPVLHIREPFQSKFKSARLTEWAQQRSVRVKGEWRLRISHAFWKISFDGKKAASGSSSWRQIVIAMRRLEGQILSNVSVSSKTGATRLEFDLGGVLEVRRFERNSTDDLWSLDKPGGYVLAVSGNGTFSHKRRSLLPEQLRSSRIAGKIKHTKETEQ